MKIALWGYYGPNYGDNIMLKVIEKYLRNNKIHYEIIDLYKISENKNINIKNNLVEFYKLSKLMKLIKVYNLSNKDIVNIWGGGTIFTDCDGDGNFRFFRAIKFFGGKIAYLGVGIGKITIKERIKKTKFLLKVCEFAIFRDSVSLNKAREFVNNDKFYLTEDLSYVYFNKFNPSKVKYDNYVLITWRNLVGYVSEKNEMKLMKDIVSACERLCNELNIRNIVLSALDHNFDIDSCNKICKMFSEDFNIEIDLDNNVDYITNLIYNSRFHFSGRLHGSIASEYFNVPTYSMAYSNKIVYFYKSISSNNYFDIYEESICYEKIKNISLRSGTRAKDDFLSKSTKNFDLLDKLLTNNMNN